MRFFKFISVSLIVTVMFPLMSYAGIATGAAFVFATGPAGLLTFRLAADWPVRVKCPACGQKRAIEAEQCGSCHQPWVLPHRNGTEIFDVPVVRQQ